MANTKPDTKPADVETVENEPETDTATETVEAPKKGRPTTRKPGGKTLSAYFDKDEYEAVYAASFEKKHRKDSELIRAAVFAYIGYEPTDESAE